MAEVWIVLVTALITRAAFTVVLEWSTVVNDSGVPLKPFGPAAFLDFAVYAQHIHSAWADWLRPWIWLQTWWGQGFEPAMLWLQQQPLKPGPLYPALIAATGFDQHPAAMCLLWQVLSLALGMAWASWFRQQGARLFWQCVAGSFPSLLYYGFLLSTDLLYAGCLAVLYAGTRAWWNHLVVGTSTRLVAALQPCWPMVVTIFLVTGMLVRPNAMGMVGMFGVLWLMQCWQLWHNGRFPAAELAVSTAASVLLALFTGWVFVYYLPYYFVHATNSMQIPYWGFRPQEFRDGLFNTWPAGLNWAASQVLFAGSKLLHLVGLRPSYGHIEPWLTAARAAPGLIFLPGLLYGAFKAPMHDRLFVVFALLPLLSGVAQERYILGLSPVLLWWGLQAWGVLLRRPAR